MTEFVKQLRLNYYELVPTKERITYETLAENPALNIAILLIPINGSL